jgi:hypothetical protein
MARRSLSTRGRILAAGVSVAVGGALIGVMAASDHTADATSSRSPAVSSPASSSSSTSATPYDGSSNGGGSFQPQAQPQTRSGGS